MGKKKKIEDKTLPIYLCDITVEISRIKKSAKSRINKIEKTTVERVYKQTKKEHNEDLFIIKSLRLKLNVKDTHILRISKVVKKQYMSEGIYEQ